MHQDDISTTNENFERYKERISNFSGEFELGLFLFIAKKSIKWILLFFIIAFAGAFLYLRYTPPVFESSSVMQVKSSNQANRVLDVENIYVDNGLAETVELLRSKVFLKRVVKKLPLDISYFAEGTFAANELYTSPPFFVTKKVNNSNIVGTKIYVEFTSDTEGILSYDLLGHSVKQKYVVDKWLHFPEIDLKINIADFNEIKKHQNVVKKNALYFIVNDPDAIVNELYPGLTVRFQNEQAKTIAISFKDYSINKAADIVSMMTEEYKNFDIERKGESAKSVIEFIDEQLDFVYEQLKSSEISIQNFKKDYKVNDNENIKSINASRLITFEDQIIALELEESVLTKIETNINNSKNIDSYNLLAMLAGTESEANITSAINELHKLLIQKEEMLYQVTSGSEAIVAIDFQIGIQKKLLRESIKSVKDNIQTRKESLKKHAAEFTNKENKLPENEIEYGRLQRLFSINEKYYTLLLEKKTEYAISKAGFVTGNVILEKASLSNTPVSPNRKITYIIFFLSAGLLCIFLIVIKYLSHNDITSLNEVVKHTNASISVLGIVPKCKQDIPISQLLVDKSPKSLIAESFRSIRTNLQFISNEPGPKIIALTSTISGEGKTFVAINLAGIIAFSDKKVLIIDLDMRKPKIHIGFNAENVKGMSTLLIGKDTIESAIQKSHLENLDFITAGPIPPNPSELIISSKMDEILAYLKTKYDVIIIDNPPVGLVSDGISMIQKADYPIYIFRADYSKRNFIQNVDRLFNEVGIKKLSIILNGVDVDRKNYGYNYGYGYGYGYGFGYGYYEEQVKLTKKNSKRNF
ncbi:MAG: polysaccharide biosynthesis tyrosine autokinase [Bacteroidia bacterium]